MKYESILREISLLLPKVDPLRALAPWKNNYEGAQLSWKQLAESYEAYKEIERLEKELFDCQKHIQSSIN